MKYRIYWKYLAKDAYLPGTTLSLRGDSVLMDNILIPPGTEMYKWKSACNYQATRSQATLPLLTRGKSYRLRLSAELTPARSLYIRINFYDRFQESVDFTILKSADEEFTYPRAAYYYDIELINAGCTKMLFHHLELEETATETAEDAPCSLNILFWDKEAGKELATSLYAGRSDTLILTEGTESLYFAEQELKTVEQFVDRYPALPISFIGSGPCGNFAALYHAMYFELGRAYVTYDMYPKKQYDKLMSHIFKQEIDVDRFLDRLSYEKKVNWYEELGEHEALSFIAPSMNAIDYALMIPQIN